MVSFISFSASYRLLEPAIFGLATNAEERRNTEG
jgi:hypothetical protein